MLRKVAVGLAALGALNAAQVKALGLGEVTVHSALNQPLNAEIDLLQIRDLTTSQIVAGLAEADEFYLAGVKPTAILSDLSFELDLSSAGGKLMLKTREPIREPFLNFLVEVNWPTGRLVKEYTLLLDPPVFSAQDLSPRAAPAAAVTQAAKPAPFTVAKPKTDLMKPAAPAVAAAPVGGDGKYFVDVHDTLWDIALKTRPDRSVSPQQMMLAIQQSNPDAFIDHNINRLRSGVVLDIPGRGEIDAMALRNPVTEVQRQNSAWRGGDSTGKPEGRPSGEPLDASMPADQGAVPKSEDSQLRIVSKEAAAESADEPEQTVSSDTASTDASPVQQELVAKNRELEEQLVVTLEGLDKVERDNAELFTRLERISEQMESMQRLLELKDQQLAEMQNQVAQPEAAPAPAPAPTPAPVAAAQPAKTSFVDALMQSPALLGGVGAGLLGLLGGLFWFLRKRKQDEEADELAVAEAMAVLDAQEQPVDGGEGVAPEAEATSVVEQAAAFDQFDGVDEAEVEVAEDPNDPFNAVSDADVSEFDSLKGAGDLDMDLKIDEPVVDDLDLDQFSESLLNDDDFDLAVDDGAGAQEDAAASDETEMLDDLDLVLGGDEAEVEAAAEDDGSTDALAGDMDGELDAILSADEPRDGSDAGTEETQVDSLEDDLDALLAADDAAAAPEAEVAGELEEDLDALLAADDADAAPEAEVAGELEDDLDALLAADDADAAPEVEAAGELEEDLDALLAADDAAAAPEMGGAGEPEDDLDALLAADDAGAASEVEATGELEEDLDALLAADEDGAAVQAEGVTEALGDDLDGLLGADSDQAAPGSAEEGELDRLLAEEGLADSESGAEVGLSLEDEGGALQVDGEDALDTLQLDKVEPAGQEEIEHDEDLEALLADNAEEDESPESGEELDLEALSALSLEGDDEPAPEAESEAVAVEGLSEEGADADLTVGELLMEEPQPDPVAEPEVALELDEDESDEGNAAVDSLLHGLPEMDEGETDLAVLEAEMGGVAGGGEKAPESLSGLALDENLDAAADEDLEAELNLMLEQEGNELALEESGGDEALDYLEDADEVGTKLDLARAYVDMDDREGAADILAEVVKEGSAEQIAEAREMLDSLNTI